MPKILVLDGLSDEGVARFRQAEGFEVDVKPPQKPDELAAIIGDYDGLVVRSGTKVTAEALAKADNLKVIGRAGVGTDNIDKPEATKRGIVVMNTPGGNTISTCEHAFALLFALCRSVAPAHQSMMEGRWDRKKFMGTEVRGKTLGIIGMGRIGAAVAKRALAFEMKVISHDPFLTQLKADALGIELVTLDDIITRSDFISIHAPKSEETNDLIRAEELAKMKPNCRIVNCARGGIVNEADLAEALKNKTIAGAALDVYTSEPFENSPFAGLDNIVMTPHLAASTQDAQLTVAVEIADQMIDYLDNGTIVNAVNVPSLDKEARQKLEPMLNLAKRLGRFQSLYMEGRPISIEVNYAGDIGVIDTHPITAAILTGFLSPRVEMVNEVSAVALVSEYGIEVSETRQARASDYAFEISLTVTTEEESHVVSGTLFHGGDPRICRIDNLYVDAHPEGHMLVCMNDDEPRILGGMCMVIGEYGVNIANLTLGRDKRGGTATTVLNLDGPLPNDILDTIRALPHVNNVRLVAL